MDDVTMNSSSSGTGPTTARQQGLCGVFPGRQAGALLHRVRPGEAGLPGRDRHHRAYRQRRMSVSSTWIDCARPGAETVLLSAGLGGTAGYWTPQLAALCASAIASSPHRPAPAAIAGRCRPITASRRWPTRCWPCSTRPPHRPATSWATRWALWQDSISQCAEPERLRSLTVVNGWAAAHAHTRRCFEMRLALLKHGGPAAYVRAQPIFLYPADWLARNAERMEEEEALGLAGFQGADTLQRRIAALLAFDAKPHLGSVRSADAGDGRHATTCWCRARCPKSLPRQSRERRCTSRPGGLTRST